MFKLSEQDEARAVSLHRRALVVDTHNDTLGQLMTGPASPRRDFSLHRTLGERSKEGQIDIPRIIEGGVDCLVFALCVTDPLYRAQRLRRILQMLDVFYSEVEKNADRIALATTYHGILDTVQKGKIAAVLSVEGGEALDGDLGVLRMLYKLGVRMLTLTHFPRNALGDGSRDDAGSHLTAFGVAVVEEMNRLGMIVDVSHLNERGFWDVLEISKRPMIASHSNCKALSDHHRNLSDEQITALAQKGGVVNLSYCGRFIKHGVTQATLKEVELDDWLRHVDHLVDLVGADYIGLGSDFDGGCGFPGMEDITRVPDVTRGLVGRGYAEEDIEKILGSNNLRVFKDVLHRY
jgi:membrane dipeptidase